MAITYQDYTGNGSTAAYNITFDFLEAADVKVMVGGVTKTVTVDYTVNASSSPPVLTFTSGSIPANNATIRIYRNTDTESARHTYQGGSSIKSSSLNENQKQILYKLNEIGIVTPNDEGLGLTSGSKGDIQVNTASDWYIKTQVVEEPMMADNSVSTRMYQDGSIQSVHLVDDSVIQSKIADLAIDTARIASKAVNASKIADNTITGGQLADDCINSEHYVDGSIDNEHLADNAVDSAELKAGSVDLTHLSATGTANGTTYLRGDNVWGTVDTGFATGLAIVTSTSSWSIPAGTTTVKVVCIGGGGGSGSAHSNFDDDGAYSKAGGGGAGCTSTTVYDGAALGTSAASITIGAGGTAGIYQGAVAGAGGTTTFDPSGSGTNLTAGGGTGSGSVDQDQHGEGGAGGTAASGHRFKWYGSKGNHGNTVANSVGANGDPSYISNAPLGDGITYGRGAEPHAAGDGNNENGNSGYAGAVYIFYN